MKLLLIRAYKKPSYTIGKLLINNAYFCDTLELPSISSVGIHKGAKTCIPIGSYRIILNVSPKFGRLLPRLLNVPNFEGVLIHVGNTVKDTSGCILVGFNTKVGCLSSSKITEESLIKLMLAAQSRGESITIDIV